MTMPLIHALRQADASDQAFIRQTIKNGDGKQLHDIQTILAKTNALDYTRKRAEQEASIARVAISGVSPSIYNEALLALLDFSVERDH